MEVFWYLPTQGDERYLGTTIGRQLLIPICSK